ncbi:acyl-CoA dehydrogenase [Sulfitobacter sp. SK012]|uniref:FAS1-like dehydratase domain-containing protein n=1 Tax=Sulfitobacter sp. SK012 TaxID=1389005 RepID=UPI000E0B6F74|nr:MaoC family dehydratase N-terminal domain-containing protein [Sulfitobacter sp. SK012]AXI48275.1 acyl-CoA dehydrogenase [Sulfitobacter sp. SK012]
MTSKHDPKSWIGRTAQMQDNLRPQPAQFMQATLDRSPSFTHADPLPPLWHWLYFLEATRHSELGRDAQPKKGGFLPPIALPRRMWAGGNFTFHVPLILGKDVAKHSAIKSVVEKDGRSGKLCFVQVEHKLYQDDRLALTEEHDIVYRADPDPAAPSPVRTPAPLDPEFSRVVTPSEALLFRYSALTFNGHRIHYDADYARDVEGYDGLVFHGPLTATLLVDLACAETGQTPRQFAFRALAPISGPTAFHIKGRRTGNTVDLWAKRHDGVLAMTAKAHF